MSTARYDIFKFYKDGSVLWLGVADSIEDAQKCVAEQPLTENSKICLRDQLTGAMKTWSPSSSFTVAQSK